MEMCWPMIKKYRQNITSWKNAGRMQLALRKDLLAGIISEEEQIQFGKIYAEREDAIKEKYCGVAGRNGS